MPGTLTIPRVVLPAGAREFPPSGGHPAAGADTLAVLTVDRAVAGGLNAQPGTVTVTIEIWLSLDGGTSWDQAATSGMAGGTWPGRNSDGTPATVRAAEVIGVSLWPGAGRLARARITVAGGPVAVAGTLTVS